MRKYIKTRCGETLKVLEKAHGETLNFIDAGRIAEVQSLLEQCQQAAISVGRAIENSGDDADGTMRVLEEYCELLYQYHEALPDGLRREDDIGQKENAARMKERLDKLIRKALHSLEHEIPERTEVLFLPYKASMWDSFETVWERYDADESCEAVVVPVPYFDKDKNENFTEMHYEAEEFPENVPVVHYNDYDYAGRHPDIIYIHNPYDDMNYVTSVDPFFYSDNLKQYTE